LSDPHDELTPPVDLARLDAERLGELRLAYRAVERRVWWRRRLLQRAEDRLKVTENSRAILLRRIDAAEEYLRRERTSYLHRLRASRRRPG
jgi:hypothetical protein